MLKAMVLTSCVLLGVSMGKSGYAQTGSPANATKEQNESLSDQEITEVTVLLQRKRYTAPIFDNNRPLNQPTSADGCGYKPPPGPEDYIAAYIADFTGSDPRDQAGAGTLDASDEPLTEAVPTTLAAVSRPDNCEIARGKIARNDKTLKAAFTLYEEDNFPQSLAMFKKAYSKIGYHIAAVMIGDMYLQGTGTPKDVNAAIFWYRKAADTRIYQPEPFDPKNPEAMSPRIEAAMKLAEIYFAGVDVPRDPKAGLRWLERASVIGYVPATKVVGDFYYKGFGTKKNFKKAVQNYRMAAELGYAPAQYGWARILQAGEAGIKADPVKARDLYYLSAHGGYPAAQYQMAVIYETGEGVKVDAKKALIYYKDAALAGDADAQNAIGTYFYQGGGLLPKDDAVARQWFFAAARTGHSEAAFNLAVMYAKGEGGPKDLVTACLWFDVAHRAGHPNAATAKSQVMKQLTDTEKVEISKRLTPAT